MDLKFLGRGSAFNVLEGNTSCYFIEKDELFLIDCGENVFNCLIKKKLSEYKLLKKIKPALIIKAGGCSKTVFTQIGSVYLT